MDLISILKFIYVHKKIEILKYKGYQNFGRQIFSIPIHKSSAISFIKIFKVAKQVKNVVKLNS